nr:hypothetical protein CFP56_31746 [Quercus suber]
MRPSMIASRLVGQLGMNGLPHFSFHRLGANQVVESTAERVEAAIASQGLKSFLSQMVFPRVAKLGADSKKLQRREAYTVDVTTVGRSGRYDQMRIGEVDPGDDNWPTGLWTKAIGQGKRAFRKRSDRERTLRSKTGDGKRRHVGEAVVKVLRMMTVLVLDHRRSYIVTGHLSGQQDSSM